MFFCGIDAILILNKIWYFNTLRNRFRTSEQEANLLSNLPLTSIFFIMGGIILTLVAVIAIIILVCIGRQRQTKHLAVSDPVTGALNMTGFRLAAEKSFRSHSRN